MTENLDLVRSIYADWERGDFGRGDWADPSIEFQRVDGPAPGAWRGKEQIAAGMREMLSAWEATAANLFHVVRGKVMRVVTYYSRDRAFADLGLTPGET